MLAQQQDAINKQEIVEQLLADMTPEISKELVKELREKYENKFQEEVQLLKLKAKQSCEGIVEEKIEELHSDQLQDYKKRRDQYEERQKELNFMKLSIMKEVETTIYDQCMQQLEEEKDRLMKQFNDVQNQNKKHTQLEKEIGDRVAFEFKETKTFEIQRKEKLMKLNYKKKFEEEKEHMQKEYSQNIDQDFEKQMSQIEQQRAEIAKATATNNIRVKQCKEEKEMLLQQRKDMDRDCNTIIQQLQQDLSNLKQELDSLQQQHHQHQQQQLQQQQQAQQHQQLLMSSDKKHKQFAHEYEQDQRYLFLRQQQEEEEEAQYQNHDEHHQNRHQNDLMSQEEQIRKNNLFSQTNTNFNEYFNMLNNSSQAPHFEDQKMGLTTQLFNTNHLQNTKSPFLLSLTNKLNMNSTNVDHKRIMQQFEESQKLMPSGINLLAPPQAIFLPNGEQFQSRENNNLFDQNQEILPQQDQHNVQQKFQPIKEYNTAELAAKLLDQISVNKQGNAQPQQQSLFTKLPSLSQQFSKMFLREISNTNSTKSAVAQDEQQKENIGAKNENVVSSNFIYVPENPNTLSNNQDKYESVLQRLKQKLSNYNFDGDQENKHTESKSTEKKENKNKNDLSYKSSLTFNANYKHEGSRYEQALSQEMKSIPNSKRGQKKPSSIQQLLQQQQQTSGPMTKYKQFFLVNDSDNQKSRKLKLLHSGITELLNAEYELEVNVKILQERIFSEYIPSLNASEETQKDLISEFQNVLYLWEMTNTHLESRQAYLEEIFAEVKQVSEVRQKLKFEQEYIENMKIPELEQQLSIMLNQRHQFKNQIDTSSENIFSYKTNKRFYNAIRNINLQIEPLLQKYYNSRKTPFIWRGIKVEDLLSVDKFEEEVVQKEELREEIQKKVFKKF